MDVFLTLLAALLLVFFVAQIFTNALEVLGERMGVSEGVTGSVFAAVGTAMPETIVPMVAILAGGASEAVNREVGLGAILGAPFMLATLSLGLMGIAAGMKHGWRIAMQPEPSGFRRDMVVFLSGYLVVVIAALLPAAWETARSVIAIGLLMLYFFYLLWTIRASQSLVEEGHGTEADGDLYFKRLAGDSMPVILVQLLVGLALLVWGARLFVHGVEHASQLFAVSALVVSLLIVPVATELPEKVNSILWIRRRRDTLAFGNISGAMVFQGTVIPAIGMMLMPWHFSDNFAVMAVVLALAGCGWLWLLQASGRLMPRLLIGNALLYGLFVAYVAV